MDDSDRKQRGRLPLESDWTLFRERHREWIDRYYVRILAGCEELLHGPGTPSERFWKIEKHIRE